MLVIFSLAEGQPSFMTAFKACRGYFCPGRCAN